MSQSSTDREFPYARYANSREWSVIDRALLELIDNRDLKEATSHEYVVGYLCKALEASKGQPRREAANGGETTELEQRIAIFERTRHAIHLANPEGRDLVQELIDERRQEAACE